jgi:succinate dehydrogenase / fumarate reductase iron-sulfur subunit
MEWILDILRRDSREKAPYRQSFRYETDDKTETVATALTALGDMPDLRDTSGRPAGPIRWACSCLQKKCGACAMVIDRVPRLACDVKLADCEKTIRLEPLKKFPVVADLIVDRTVMQENLKALRLWLEDAAVMREPAMDTAYDASRCLQCGCCLEVCPNFYAEGSFTGMAVAIPFSRLLAELPASQKKEAARLYHGRFYEGCGKSLACRNICPAGIDVDRLLVNSNAAAVWKRFGTR